MLQVNAVIRLQAFWRARKAKRDYKALVDVEAPSVSTVKKFLSLLEQSDLDFSEEIGTYLRHPPTIVISECYMQSVHGLYSCNLTKSIVP